MQGGVRSTGLLAMEALKQVYLEKCKQFACDPIQPLVEDLAAAHGCVMAG